MTYLRDMLSMIMIREKPESNCFNGWEGNALRTFYSVFTPSKIFEILENKINGDIDMKREALKIIYKKEGMKYEDKFVYSNRVPEVFVKNYLMGKGIVVRSSKRPTRK